MKILLMGEYSGVYTELRAGLKALGHDVFLIANGDGVKNYNSDLKIDLSRRRNNLIYRCFEYLLFRFGLDGLFRLKQNWSYLKPHISGFDAVLLINPIVDGNVGPLANFVILRYIFKSNKSAYLSVLGDDYYVAKYYAKHKLQNGFYNLKFRDFIFPQWHSKYRLCFGYKFVNDYVVKHVSLIIPGTPTYEDSYSWCSRVSSFIPFPLSEVMLGKPFSINKDKPIVIFHGWQIGKEQRKGNDIIDRVIRRVVDYYGPLKINYHIVSNVPYAEYVKMFNSCHIFIDQLYAEDKGYNGLLGMAAGKVVFSGFKTNVLSRFANFNGKVVGISASQSEEELFNQFCNLIDNPSKMEEISVNAIDFVKKYHLTKIAVKRYIDILKSVD